MQYFGVKRAYNSVLALFPALCQFAGRNFVVLFYEQMRAFYSFTWEQRLVMYMPSGANGWRLFVCVYNARVTCVYSAGTCICKRWTSIFADFGRQGTRWLVVSDSVCSAVLCHVPNLEFDQLLPYIHSFGTNQLRNEFRELYSYLDFHDRTVEYLKTI